VDDLAVRVVGEPTRWVSCLGRNILESDGEVDQVQVKVVNAPVLELLLCDRLDLLVIVEGLPELGDDEELFALYEALLDGAGNTLAGFDFIAVICLRLSADASFVPRAISFRWMTLAFRLPCSVPSHRYFGFIARWVLDTIRFAKIWLAGRRCALEFSGQSYTSIRDGSAYERWTRES
jgi:hypothetical protein